MKYYTKDKKQTEEKMLFLPTETHFKIKTLLSAFSVDRQAYTDGKILQVKKCYVHGNAFEKKKISALSVDR